MTDLTNINNDDANVTIELDTLLEEVQICITKCQSYHRISGIGKLERKFRAEERFLKRVCIIDIVDLIRMNDLLVTSRCLSYQCQSFEKFQFNTFTSDSRTNR